MMVYAGVWAINSECRAYLLETIEYFCPYTWNIIFLSSEIILTMWFILGKV